MGLNVPGGLGPGRKRTLLLLAAVAASATAILWFGPVKDYALGGGGTQSYVIDGSKCLVCHSNPDLAKPATGGGKTSLYVNPAAVNISSHRYIDCTTCHTTKPHEVATPLTKLSLAQKCGSCHQFEYQQHLESVHGQQLGVCPCKPFLSLPGIKESSHPAWKNRCPGLRKEGKVPEKVLSSPLCQRQR